MQFKTDRTLFLAALEACARVVPKRSIRPVLESVLVSADTAGAQGLTVLGTNLEESVLAACNPAFFDAGSVLLPLHDALRFLRACDGTTLELEVFPMVPGRLPVLQEASPALGLEAKVLEPAVDPIAARIVLVTDQGESLEALALVGVDEFPAPLTTSTVAVTCELSALALRDAIERVLPAVACEPGRYSMHGILCELEGQTLTLVGTDGRRLAVAPLCLERTDYPSAKGILARHAAAMLAKSISKAEGARVVVTLDPTCGAMSFRVGSVLTTCRVIDGEFPRYRAILREEHDTRALVDSEELLARLKMVSTVCADDARAVMLESGPTASSLALRARSGSRKASAELKTSSVQHVQSKRKGASTGPAKLTVNPDYLADGIKACRAEHTVSIRWRAANEPLEVQGDDSFRYLLMPITIDA